MTDLHTHLLPGVDDGAATIAEARSGLESARAEGIRSVVVTPHLDASLSRRPRRLEKQLARFEGAWVVLRDLAAAEFPELRLERGVELMLDTPDPDLRQPALRLAGTSFVLIEFLGVTIPPNASAALAKLVEAGLRPVLAHPERYDPVQRRPDLVDEWRSIGCYLQVNAGALLGRYGRLPEMAAVALLRAGKVDYISSDFHSRGRPGMLECREHLVALGAVEQAELLMRRNGERLLNDELPLRVPPLPAGLPWWRRLLPPRLG